MLIKNYLRTHFKVFFILSICLIGSCGNKHQVATSKSVFITENDGKFQLYKNGKPYFIKGAAGHTNLKKLKEIGGNTIRTYDTLNLGSILDDAQKNGLTVMVGISLPESKYSDFVYNKPEMVAKQFQEVKQLVNKYKDHPAILMWCVGNELDFSPNPKLYNFYKAFNNIVEMIHQDDPDHPVTTTMVNFYPKNLICINLFTDIDILSTNFFVSMDEMEEELKKVHRIWKGPFIVAEWGIDGPWQIKKNAWGAQIENVSHKKAERYRDMYKYLPNENPRFLGSLVFYWGAKQEGTHTWFSMFDEKGNQSEAVGMMEYNWTGKNPEEEYPDLNDMTLDGRNAVDNIILKPGQLAEATLIISKPDTSNHTLWEIYPEDWFYAKGVKNAKRLKPVETSFITYGYQEANFKAPLKEGPYRIFATIYNTSGGFATCNTPFYVVANR